MRNSSTLESNMGGPLFYVLFLVMGSQAMSQSFMGKCDKTGWEEALKEMERLLPKLASCTKYEDLQQGFQTNPLNTYDKICKQKDELLKCTDKIFETVERCLPEKQKVVWSDVQRARRLVADFICKHKMDILTVVTSSEEQKCLQKVSDVGTTKCNAMNLVSDLQAGTIIQACKKLHVLSKCVENNFDECKSSTVQRLFSAMDEEVLEEVKCSGENKDSGAASLLARVAFIPKAFIHVILATIIPYILHY